MDKLNTTDFDYDSLELGPRLELKTKEAEIEVLIGQTELYAKQTIQAAIETGQKLIEAREIFRHNKQGGFEGWWKSRFGKSKQTAYNYINVAENLNRQTVGRLKFDPSALYLLAAPSIPESIRQEAIERAESGETITKGIAKEIIGSYKNEEDRKQEWQKLHCELDQETMTELHNDEAGIDKLIKRTAQDFIEVCKIAYEAYELLGYEKWIEWLLYAFDASKEVGGHILEAYERFGNNPQLVIDFANEIFNKYSDDLIILAGFGSVLQSE